MKNTSKRPTPVPGEGPFRLTACTTLVLVQPTGKISPLQVLPELMSALPAVAASVVAPLVRGSLVPVIIDQRSSGAQPPLLRGVFDVVRGDLRWDSVGPCRREAIPAEAAGLLGLQGQAPACSGQV